MATVGVGAFLLVLLAFVGADDATDSKVHLKVYYESLCPDSVRFVRNQLIPTWNSLGGDYLQIDFLPFGKARSSRKPGGGLSFTCQHGPRECAGNMVMACGLSNLLTDHDLRVKFVGCVMSSSDPPSAGAKCAPTVGLDYSVIEECMDSPAGEALLYNYEQRTLKLYPKGLPFVPTITINGKFDQDAQDASLRDLKSVVCAYIPESARPAQCL
ncbi:GILT-like protein 1 [Cloeon dipterum]|uniref:GILT-like protein 1 n=1 Tax=Cloeon dipterum TaxID=197152 RepID=UPI00322077BD